MTKKKKRKDSDDDGDNASLNDNSDNARNYKHFNGDTRTLITTENNSIDIN